MPFTVRCPYNPTAIRVATDRSSRRILRPLVVAPTLGLLLSMPIATLALELGEASIRSGLGQSLLVEIPYRLAANERLAPSCIALVPATRSAEALPVYTRAGRISISPTHIQIAGNSRVFEPLIGINVEVSCDTAPHFMRSYQLFVDPPVQMPAAIADSVRVAARERTAATPVAAGESIATASLPAPATARTAVATDSVATVPGVAATASARANTSPRARGQDGGTVTQGQTYRVVRGDTLSGIAARVAGRTTTIREAADAIFAANADAFTRGNRDLIEAGRSIAIPFLGAAATEPSLAVAPVGAPAAAPTVREVESPAAALPPRVEPAPSVVAPAAAIESPPVAPAVVPTAAPAIEAPPAIVAPQATPTVAARSAFPWLTALSVLGVVILLSAPLVFMRKRDKQPPPSSAANKPQKAKQHRTLAPTPGIEVVEGRAGETATIESQLSSLPVVEDEGTHELAAAVDAAAPVDLDVGVPVVMEERVDWFGERAAPSVDTTADTVEENAVTALLPELGKASAAEPRRQPQSKSDAAGLEINDEQFTLTVAELDMLRLDYEAEHTLTQQSSQALRDAVADLEATKAKRASAGDTVTLEVPLQADEESADSAATTARILAK